MILLILSLFDGRPWPGMPPHPRTLGDVLAALDARPRVARIVMEVGR